MLQEHRENLNIAAANGAIKRSSRSVPRLNGKSGASNRSVERPSREDAARRVSSRPLEPEIAPLPVAAYK